MWFNGRKTQKQHSPKPTSKKYGSPMYDDREVNVGSHDDRHVLSFDAAVLMSQELDRVKEVPKEEQDESNHYSRNGNGSDHLEASGIWEEPRTCEAAQNGSVALKRSWLKQRQGLENGSTSEICVDVKESAIRRETESDFRTEDNRKEYLSQTLEPGDISAASLDNEEVVTNDAEYVDEEGWGRRELEIVCRHIDHVNMLGLNKTTSRLRGRSKGLINPEIVQKLAENEGISLGIGFLSHIRILDGSRQQRVALNLEDTTLCRPMENGRRDGKGSFVRLEVVTASLGFLTNFEDVYKLWGFVAKFLNPTFMREGGLPTVEEGSET
ncbi:hypothetical protein PIB30_073536 [Stylosanthes scabra]|uniref:Uncharacterized protein n=1 Tax=Stylosanthes scabra TaxID=79078 RepID=A0ABU6UR45_9FABA|nr:hypothetical protein [Stylosanthes scabra]